MTIKSNLLKKRALLIMPPFYEYKDAISKELERQGWGVDWISDTIVFNPFEKIIKKMCKTYPQRHFDAYFSKAIGKIKSHAYDKILIIFGAPFIHKRHLLFLKDTFPSSKIIYYAWDSVASFPNIAELLTNADTSYTFDENDSSEYKSFFLPLFYTETKQPMYDIGIKYSVSTIMSFYIEKKDNFIFLLNAISKYKDVFVYLNVRGWFQNTLLRMKMRKEYKKIKKYIHFNSLPYCDVQRIISQSQAILDCPLPTQKGLTMRVFEALSLKKKIITTNESIKKYSFYCPDNIYVLQKNETIPKSFFEKPFNDSYCLSEEYNISSFIRRLMN